MAGLYLQAEIDAVTFGIEADSARDCALILTQISGYTAISEVIRYDFVISSEGCLRVSKILRALRQGAAADQRNRVVERGRDCDIGLISKSQSGLGVAQIRRIGVVGYGLRGVARGIGRAAGNV